MYIFRNPEVTANFVQRAEKEGYKALVITVDIPIRGKRLPNIRNSFSKPHYLTLANFNATSQGKGEASSKESKESPDIVVESQFAGMNKYTRGIVDPSQSWERIGLLCRQTRLPVILKGILTAEDAREALRHGVKGIIVSNHGGRQLDGTPATV